MTKESRVGKRNVGGGDHYLLESFLCFKFILEHGEQARKLVNLGGALIRVCPRLLRPVRIAKNNEFIQGMYSKGKRTLLLARNGFWLKFKRLVTEPCAQTQL